MQPAGQPVDSKHRLPPLHHKLTTGCRTIFSARPGLRSTLNSNQIAMLRKKTAQAHPAEKDSLSRQPTARPSKKTA
jgi:hypothetical protein